MAASFADPPLTDLVRIDVVRRGSSVRAIAVGEIDSSSAPVLARRLEELLRSRPDQLTVDLCGVTFLDSAGLCVLAATHRQAGDSGTGMRVLASSRAVIRPLEITGLWRLLGAEQVDPATNGESVA